MASWRDIKAEGREVVHTELKIPCRYIAELPYDSNSSPDDPPTVGVRLLLNDKKVGAQPGQNNGSAERFEPVPKAIFWRAELDDLGITIARNAVISVVTGEAYTIDFLHPHDVETITAEVTRLDATDSAGLPVPAEDDG